MGKIFKFHTDVDTDQIIASQYLLFPTIDEMKAHTFESLDPTFAERVKPGDYVVAAENFGCGSSREQAPSVLKALGVKAVLPASSTAMPSTSVSLLSSARISMITYLTVMRWNFLCPTELLP